jgi:hypothetical protein
LGLGLTAVLKSFDGRVHYAIVASSNSLYCAGFERAGAGNAARMWKITDGKVTAVTLTAGARDSRAFATAGSGDDVHSAGYSNNDTSGKAVLWHIADGAVRTVPLPDGKKHSSVQAVTVLKEGVHCAGYERNSDTTAMVWYVKNNAVFSTIRHTGKKQTGTAFAALGMR